MGNPLFLRGGEPVDFTQTGAGRVASHKSLDQRVKRAVA
jgi:hypothetical protein